ncbi:ca2+:cation antiporter family [Stylonychia lemnae]|uniref:Ca2+:cation antiporter family n=1 Tax=Stylonychia lemnae TaxID=5949 RepID=A0A078AE46_STYLE|nr:ca2+:cation antiporter family [Stylonychia lemnae]|eukprot:CDW80524.1 ca2+:cation antiporter family [Stylonychia lemnae]
MVGATTQSVSSTVLASADLIKSIDLGFYKLQMNESFFIFEIIFGIYLLLNLALIAEKYLMPCLMNISKRYNMSRDLTGILVAIGNLVPELTTTILSFLKHGVKMTEFGIACNVGTSIFVITVVPAVAILMTIQGNTQNARQEGQSQQNSDDHNENQDDEDENQALIEKVDKEVDQDSGHNLSPEMEQQMMSTIFRDMGFFIAGLILYEGLLYKGIIYFHEAIALFLVVVLYIFVIFKMEKQTDKNEQIKSLVAKGANQMEQSSLQHLPKQQSDDQCFKANDKLPSSYSNSFQAHGKEQDLLSMVSKQDYETLEKESKMLHYLELLCYPAIKLLGLILPVQKSPIAAFLIIVALFFISMDFILTLVSVMSVYTHLSSVLIALTIMSWGSSPIELINLIIASKKGELQIGLTSILSGIVFTFFILMPLAMIFKMIKKETHEIEVISPIHSSNLMFLPALILTLFTTFIYWKTRMNFGKYSASALIISYSLYLGYMYYELKGDKI